MEKIRLITDAASDISYEDEAAFDIRVIPFQVTLGDNAYLSRVDFNNQQFYDLMAQYDEIPKTSQINPFEFQEIYLQEAQAGYTDLILILINAEGSATYSNSLLAKDLFFEEHPEYRGKVRIHSFDSRGYSLMYGALVLEAARMLDRGASADQLVQYLSDEIPLRQVYFGVYSLRYAGKSGRIPSAAAFIGDKLNLKPVMKIYHNAITTAAKCRGEAKLIGRIAEMTFAEMEPGTPYDLVYGCDKQCLEALAAQMTQLTGYPPAACYQIGAAVAANAGPKVVGTGFSRKRNPEK